MDRLPAPRHPAARLRRRARAGHRARAGRRPARATTFNQELYGRATDLPWAVEIDRRVPAGRRCSTRSTYHPTFLYELLWNVGVAGLVVWADRRFRLGHGRAFALYVAAYTVGRVWIEGLRIDPANEVLGLRLNEWTSLVGVPRCRRPTSSCRLGCGPGARRPRSCAERRPATDGDGRRSRPPRRDSRTRRSPRDQRRSGTDRAGAQRGRPRGRAHPARALRRHWRLAASRRVRRLGRAGVQLRPDRRRRRRHRRQQDGPAGRPGGAGRGGLLDGGGGVHLGPLAGRAGPGRDRAGARGDRAQPEGRGVRARPDVRRQGTPAGPCAAGRPPAVPRPRPGARRPRPGGARPRPR